MPGGFRRSGRRCRDELPSTDQFDIDDRSGDAADLHAATRSLDQFNDDSERLRLRDTPDSNASSRDDPHPGRFRQHTGTDADGNPDTDPGSITETDHETGAETGAEGTPSGRR